MEHHPTFIGDVVNWLLGWLALPLLEGIGIHPHDAHRPIPDHIATQLFIVALSIVFFLWFRKRLSADNPGSLQLCFEKVLSNPFRVGIYDLLDEIVGHGGRQYLAIIGTVGLYVLFCNVISLVPGFVSPTAHHTVPLGCAIVVFLYYNYAGVCVHGPLGYGKHFLGPVLPMAPLMVIVEVVSNLARLLSLTVRLWVNMVVSELLYLTFLGLGLAMMAGAWKINAVLGGAAAVAPLVIPLAFVLLHIFVAFLQAFVFTLLPVVYVAGAVAEEH
jgi:F-type H+-transporting ATPase subunit a